MVTVEVEYGSKENEKIIVRLYWWLEEDRIHFFFGKIERGLMSRKLKDDKGW